MCAHIDGVLQATDGQYTAELIFQTLLLEIIWLLRMLELMKF